MAAADGEDGASGIDDVFPARLAEARKLRGLSAVDLGRRCGIPASSISHFEAGNRKPSFANLAKLATELKVSTDYLLGRADAPDLAPVVEAMFRQANGLTADDLALAAAFIEMLVGRDRTRPLDATRRAPPGGGRRRRRPAHEQD